MTASPTGNGRRNTGKSLQHPSREVEFSFTFTSREMQHCLKVAFDIPLKSPIHELAFRLIASHGIPCYLHDELYKSLETFIVEATKEFEKDVIYCSLFKRLKEPNTKEKIREDWTQVFSKGQLQNSNESSIGNAWSDIYHSLIHSPALDTLLRLEYSFGQAMRDIIKQKDNALKELTERQVQEMEELVSLVGVTKTDDDVNALASHQLEESQMQEIYWSSALSELQETQKREYREWVLTVHEKTIADDSYRSKGPSPRVLRSPSQESYQVNYDVSSTQDHYMEESFTIYLGNQMKSMHNIRLICRDILDYCQCKTTFVGGSIVPQPQRLQTALTLYSEKLSALVLFVDNRLHTSLGIKKRFREICHESTDFHFPDIDKQICLVEQNLSSRPAKSQSATHGKTRDPNKLLQTGDFYITKHSNLAEVHCVFNLVSDDSLMSSDLNSRHAIMTGIRNIMLAATRHSITNVALPLLLVHEMNEGMTVQWCLKRAELVFKCVKGFMMESLSWDGHDERTLQFVVPTGISKDLFNSLSNMLPSIFRVSTTLDLSSISTK